MKTTLSTKTKCDITFESITPGQVLVIATSGWCCCNLSARWESLQTKIMDLIGQA